ncbi:MAG: TolC family protein [Nitrospinae bacterium]|nr:TolC family protein [Nitrospinota bacterium]
MMKKIVITMLSVLLAPMVVRAGNMRLTADDAVALAMKNNRLVRISTLRAESASARHDETVSAQMPTLQLQAGYTKLSNIPALSMSLPAPPPAPPNTWFSTPLVLNIPDTYALKANVQYPLFTGHALEGAERAADYNAQASEHDLSNDKSGLTFAVKNAYWGLYKAIRVKAVLDKNVEQIGRHLDDVKAMVEAGILLRDEQLKAEVRLLNTRFSQKDAENNVRLAMMTLDNIIGLPLDAEIEPTSKLLPENKPIRPLADYIGDAVNQRPDLKAALMRESASGEAVLAAKGAYYPQVALFGDLNYLRPNPRIFPNVDQFDNTWDVGFGITYSLLDWGLVKNRVRQAEAAQSQAEFETEQLKDNLALDVNQSYLFLRQAGDRISVARQGVEEAEESHRITKDRFGGGFATNTEVLDAEVALLQAQLNYTVSIVDYEIADAKMRQSVGETQGN